jgi:voltage-gated potassium channel
VTSKTHTNTRTKSLIYIIIAVLTVVSIIVVFVDFLFPLSNEQRWTMYIFDLIVTGILIIDFIDRFKSSSNKVTFLIAHWYEYPAMIPLIVYGVIDSTVLIGTAVRTIRFLAFFRLVRLYNIALMIKGSEILLLCSLAVVTIVFGSFGIYFVESPNPEASIDNLHDAFWWSIETITTVAYGEYYPITPMGRVIAAVLMFAAIGILWTVVALITSKLVESKVNSGKSISIAEDTKSVIKSKIDNIEKLSKYEVRDLIRMIRALNYVDSRDD